jgi:hypothetical protein
MQEQEKDEELMPLEIEEVMSSSEYTYADIYYNNKKYEKTIKLLTRLSDSLKVT